jgi:formylglycine-generating enzyme required for sulfatase activity
MWGVWLSLGFALGQEAVEGQEPAEPAASPGDAPIDASVFDAPTIEGVEGVDAFATPEATPVTDATWPGQDALPSRTSGILGPLLPLVPGAAKDGSPLEDGPSAWDEPERTVVLGGVVWMTRAEVTRAQWAVVHPFYDVGDCPDCPVTEVSWDEAMQYARAVGQREARRYRLPTEAEWATAALAGRPVRYPGGQDAGPVAWTKENSEERLHPVCTREVNPGGFCDLGGNAMEWTLDAYIHRPAGGLDPWTAPTAARPTRVVRGGSFRLGLREARVGWRMGYLPDVIFDDLGFRLVLDPDAPPEASEALPVEAAPTTRRRGAPKGP